MMRMPAERVNDVDRYAAIVSERWKEAPQVAEMTANLLGMFRAPSASRGIQSAGEISASTMQYLGDQGASWMDQRMKMREPSSGRPWLDHFNSAPPNRFFC